MTLGHDLIEDAKSGLNGRAVFRHFNRWTSAKIELIYGLVFGYSAGQFEPARFDHLQGLVGWCFFDLIDHRIAFTDTDV